MQSKYDILQGNEQDPQRVSQFVAQELAQFLAPFLQVLMCLLDKRLVDSCLQLCIAMIRFRNMKQGLKLSELGAYIPGYNKEVITAPAGTKRIGNFLRSLKWSANLIDKYLLDEADKRVRELVKQGSRVLCIHDSSVIEKPESDEIEGLCPVLSSKSKRLTRSKKGKVFNEPRAKPVMVTGMHWKAALIVGMQGLPQVAMMNWGTTKGDYAENQREAEREMLRHLAYKWNTLVLHIFDRGYASGAWLALAEALHVKFVIRWIKSHLFLDAMGQEKKLWQIGQNKKYFSQKLVKDVKTGIKITCDLWWAPVTHRSYARQLYVVKIRSGKHIMRLITNERISSDEQAWEIFFAYTRRWQIETAFRYGKSELAMESPCLRIWDHTLKLLGLVTLVYAFLLYLLQETFDPIKKYLLRLKCHRTGKRCQNAQAPLYRFRWALSRLWEEHPPVRTCFFPPSMPVLRLITALRGENMG
jgi:Transposase DDE domain